ncbi:N-acyl-L-amino-acid amidohydrolase, partial [Ostertagia ostertagi]
MSELLQTVAGKPFIIMTIPGFRPELKSVMLYSHTDVVPTISGNMTHILLTRTKTATSTLGGAQDMKCVGSQYFEAIRRHFQRGQNKWQRTIHIVWGPDEEIAGPDGMAKFCQMEEFRELNVGFTLDEGLASETDTYKVYYAERCTWWVKVTCSGSPGHGSKFIENTAVEKLRHVMNEALKYREEQRRLLEDNSSLTLGDVTTLNLTILHGGVQTNVLPEKFEA